MDATSPCFGSDLPLGPLPLGGREASPAVAGELQPGQVLDGRFRIQEMTNRGGMSCVYKATDLTDGASVAVKVPLLKYESDPVLHTRFLREEELALRLDHPAIPRVRPVPNRTRPYLVMEFLEGRTLNRVLAASRPLPEGEALRIASLVCEALECLRRNEIVHRDLKPENIFVCPDGSIRLLDFGIARISEKKRLTFAGLVPSMGTPDYIAPEQVRGERGGHRADLYSLGAVLYEMATGKLPFDSDNPFVTMGARTTGDPAAPRRINPQLSPQAEEIILHAMSRDPANRYETAAEMKAELDDLGLVRLTARHETLQIPTYAAAAENRWMLHGLLIAVSVIAVQFAAFGALFWYFAVHGRH